LEDLLESLSSLLQAGHKMTMGHSTYNNAYFCSLREGINDWESARAVSAWHIEPGMALRTLCYALEVRFPDFPELGDGWHQEDLVW
jgi:hypothetical protein